MEIFNCLLTSKLPKVYKYILQKELFPLNLQITMTTKNKFLQMQAFKYLRKLNTNYFLEEKYNLTILGFFDKMKAFWANYNLMFFKVLHGVPMI